MTGIMRSRRLAAMAAVACLTVLGAGCSSGVGGTPGSGGTSSGGSSGTAAAAASGSTAPASLAPFEPGGSPGAKPGLPAVIAFAQDSPRGFEQLLAAGLQAGAKDAGLRFESAESNGDPQAEVQNMQQFLVQGVGSLVVGPVDPAAQAPVMEQALQQGVDMQGIVFGPATTQANAAQYATGQVLGDLAAEYIKSHLGGKANVVILNQDSVQAIRPRFQAILQAIAAVPGARVVANVEPATTDNAGGFAAMTTILQKNSHVDIVLGADAVVEGALAALQAAHADTAEQFLGGVDCEAQALADIAKGGAYKACVATSPAIFGYALARYAGDWLAGGQVPQGVCIRPKAVVGARQAAQYTTDENNPAAVFADAKKFAQYATLYGETSYSTRSDYLAYSWAPSGC